MPPATGFPTMRVFIGFPVDPTERLFIFDVSTLDGGDVLAPADGGMEEVTSLLLGNTTQPIHIKHGRPSPLDDYETSRCEIDFNNLGGELDSLNLESPYVVGGTTLVRLGRRILVTVENATRRKTWFYGTIESYTPGVSVVGAPTMRIEASGPFAGQLSQFDPEAVGAVGEGEDAGARIHRILDNADVPDGDRLIEVGDSTVQSTTLAQNALTECRLVAASESPLGGFLETMDGRLAFDNRRKIFDNPRSRFPVATFGPPGHEVDDVFPYADGGLQPALDKQRLRNDFAVSRTGGEMQFDEDATSKASYYTQRFRRTDLLLQTDAEVVRWLEWALLIFHEAEYRYDSVRIDVLAVPDSQLADLVDVVMDLILRERIAVLEEIDYIDPDDGVTPFTRENTAECLVERIEIWGGPDALEIEYGLSSAESFRNIFTFDLSLMNGTDVLAPF